MLIPSQHIYDHVNVDGIHIGSDPNQDAVEAAQHLMGMAKEVYGVDLTASSTLDEWGKAFLAYNRGYMYKGASPEHTWDESPYVANGMDEDHMHMTWISADSCYKGTCYNSVAGQKDGNLAGAIAVMQYLGGTLGSASVCRSPAQRISGGLTEEQAQALADYYKSDQFDESKWNLSLSTRWNCVSMSAWFVQQFTSIGYYVPPDGWGNGKDVVNNLKINKGIQTGTEPRPFSIFSVTQGVTDCGNVKCGHTGVVLGVDGDDIMVLEAAWNKTGYAAVVHYSRDYFVNKQYGDTFGYLDTILDQNALSDFLNSLGMKGVKENESRGI